MSVNIYDMTDTWNDAGTTFSAIKMNVTDTNSAAASLLLDLLVGGAKKFSVQKDGAAHLYNTYTDGSNYERGFLKWNSNVLEIGTEAAGTGTARNAVIKVGGNTVLTATSGGVHSPSYTVGSGGVASNGYGVAGNAATGLVWPASGRAILFSTVNGGEGNVTLNAYNSGFGRNDAGNILSARYSSSLNTIALGVLTGLTWVDVANSLTGTPDTGLARDAAGVLKVTDGSTGTGELIFVVPTSDPGISGALWNNGGTLAISA